MVIVSAKVEGGHVLPFDCCGVAKQLHNMVNSIKYRCGDNNVLEKSSMRYFREVIKRVNKKEDEHENQKIILVQG